MAPNTTAFSIVDSLPIELVDPAVKKEMITGSNGRQTCVVTRHNMLRVS